MEEKFRVPIGLQLECPVCGAVTADPRKHGDWHDRLRDILLNGVPQAKLEDMDQ